MDKTHAFSNRKAQKSVRFVKSLYFYLLPITHNLLPNRLKRF